MSLSAQKAVAESPNALFECKSSEIMQDQETQEFTLLLTIESLGENMPDVAVYVPDSHPFYADYVALETGDRFLLESDSSAQEKDRVQCGIIVVVEDGYPFIGPLYTDTHPTKITL